jgi:hypothetical protein
VAEMIGLRLALSITLLLVGLFNPFAGEAQQFRSCPADLSALADYLDKAFGLAL